MHRGREATYEALSHDFYCPNVAKHVRNWIRRCPSCIKFKSTYPKQGPIQIRIFDGPFATIGTVGQLPTSSLGEKWILTAVSPYSNFLRAIHYQINKHILQNELCLIMYSCNTGFQQSDQGIDHIVITSYCPRVNGIHTYIHTFLLKLPLQGFSATIY